LERFNLEDRDHRWFAQDACRWRGINDDYDDARTNDNDDRAVHPDASDDQDHRRGADARKCGMG